MAISGRRRNFGDAGERVAIHGRLLKSDERMAEARKTLIKLPATRNDVRKTGKRMEMKVGAGAIGWKEKRWMETYMTSIDLFLVQVTCVQRPFRMFCG